MEGSRCQFCFNFQAYLKISLIKGTQYLFCAETKFQSLSLWDISLSNKMDFILDIIFEYINKYLLYLEELGAFEHKYGYSSIMYSEFSLNNYIFNYFEKLGNAHLSVSLTILIFCFITVSLVYWLLFFKKKYDNCAPKLCQICQVKPSRIVLIPCGHLCLCRQCLHDWLIELNKDVNRFKCIICRCQVDKYVHCYY